MIQKTLTLLAASASMFANVTQAGLYVVNPTELKALFPDKQEIKSKLSNIGYGTNQKGTSRIGQVVSPFKEDGQGCDPLKWEDFTDQEMEHFSKQEGFFLLLQRGGCSFMTKIRNAQNFGAEAIIISDYKEENWAEKEANMFDGKLDGALTAHIPAFEISWADAKNLVMSIRQGEQAVYVKAVFDVTNVSNSVEVDLWYSSSLDLGMHLSTELAAMSLSFSNDHANQPLFTPRIATFECMNCEHKFKQKHCFSKGAYCGETPVFYQEYELKKHDVQMHGKDIIIQALREKCLHQLMSTKYKDEGDLFWTFFSYLGKCFANPDLMGNGQMPKSIDECYDWSTVLIQGNEEVDAVNKCVDDSWVVPGDQQSDNKILRDDRFWAHNNHITVHPSVTINNMTHTNDSGQDLALAICSAYREAPDECELSWKIIAWEDNEFDGLVTPELDRSLHEKALHHQRKSEGQIIFGGWHMALIIVVILGINIGVMLIVRHKMKNQMQGQVNSSVNEAVSQYFQLAGQESNQA